MLLLLSVPPFAIVSVPMPELPTVRLPLLVQVEPAPVTVALPCEPAADPITPPEQEGGKLQLLLTVPPLWIVSMPVLELPTVKLLVVAAAAATTAPIPFGAVVSMMVFDALFGEPKGTSC